MATRGVKEWHRDVNRGIQDAQNCHRASSRQGERSNKVNGNVTNDNLNNFTELHNMLEQKVKSSHKLIGKLNQRSESMENSLSLTRQTLRELEAALQAKNAPLQLCVWRAEQREGRPPRERIRDGVTPALESERADLVNSQNKLNNMIRDVKTTIYHLEQRLHELRTDQAQKTQALRLDEACFESTHRTWQNSVGRTPEQHRTAVQRLPGNTGTKNSLVHEEYTATYKNEVARQRETEKVDKVSSAQEQAASTLRDQATKLMFNTSNLTKENRNKTDNALQEGVKQNQQVRKRLDFELKETQAKIHRTKVTISQTAERLDALREPMRNTSDCSVMRARRDPREHIVDPVSAKIAEHHAMLLRSHEELTRNATEERKILKQLEEHEAQLTEDLRDKTSALHIAQVCLAPPGGKNGSSPRVPPTARSTVSRGGRSKGGMSVDQGPLSPLGNAGGAALMSARF